MLIKNVCLTDREGLWQILCQDGLIRTIAPMSQPLLSTRELDGEAGLAIAPFIEPHIHLDTTQTAGEPSWNLSGTLFEGIERWAERKALLTHEDVKQRAIYTLKWQIANGIQFVRTHVDVSDPNLVALKAMLEVKEEMKEWVELQIVAFPQEGILSYPNGKALLEEALRLGADVIGAIPHFEFTREYGVESLHYIFDLAEKYQVLVDVHCDEIDDEQSRFIETLATLAYERGMGHRVTASHALLQRGLCFPPVSAAQDGGDQLRRQSVGEHPPAGTVRYLSQASWHYPGEGDAGGQYQCLLRPR
ncbi:hypothetical protein LGKMAHEF_04234 [Aeromonas salmonicida]|nr:cytosine deaminase [Aeromonas salmonicida]SUU73533.1 cytosine deaminase [Aeromonas salmonicida]